jgi:hypothetical protein
LCIFCSLSAVSFLVSSCLFSDLHSLPHLLSLFSVLVCYLHFFVLPLFRKNKTVRFFPPLRSVLQKLFTVLIIWYHMSDLCSRIFSFFYSRRKTKAWRFFPPSRSVVCLFFIFSFSYSFSLSSLFLSLLSFLLVCSIVCSLRGIVSCPAFGDSYSSRSYDSCLFALVPALRSLSLILLSFLDFIIRIGLEMKREIVHH